MVAHYLKCIWRLECFDYHIVCNRGIGGAVSVMEQSVRFTENGMRSIQEAGDSTSMITVSNEQMTKQIMEMDKTVENIRIHSSEVAASMVQVTVNTRSNY